MLASTFHLSHHGNLDLARKHPDHNPDKSTERDRVLTDSEVVHYGDIHPFLGFEYSINLDWVVASEEVHVLEGKELGLET